MSDLIARAAEGDPDAVNSLLDRFRRDIRQILERECGKRAAGQVDVSGVTQEALLYISQRIKDFRGRDVKSFLSWIKQISTHRLLDEIRRASAARRSPGRLGAPVASLDDTDVFGDRVADDTSSPSVKAARHEQLERALAKLPTNYREVSRLYFVEGMELVEIAEELHLSLEETSLRHHRAMRKLHQHLRDGHG